MYFAYGRRKRPEVTAKTTFDAVLRLERTSTTRFVSWRGFEAWSKVQEGDLVEFFEDRERRGRNLTVEVTGVSALDLASCDEETLDAWSKQEGWLPEEGRKLGQRLGKALWIQYKLVSPAPELPSPDPQIGFSF